VAKGGFCTPSSFHTAPSPSFFPQASSFLLLERLTMRIAGAVIVAIALLLVASFSPVESYGMEDGGFLLRLILKNIM